VVPALLSASNAERNATGNADGLLVELVGLSEVHVQFEVVHDLLLQLKRPADILQLRSDLLLLHFQYINSLMFLGFQSVPIDLLFNVLLVGGDLFDFYVTRGVPHQGLRVELGDLIPRQLGAECVLRCRTSRRRGQSVTSNWSYVA